MLPGFVVAVMASCVLLAGCETPASSSSASTGPTSGLWAARVAHVDDNARVTHLVEQLLPDAEFGFTINLRTATKPRRITITITRSSKPYDMLDFREQATLLLGLAADLDTVTISGMSSRHSTSVTGQVATAALGYDVKDLGRDEGRLAAYLAAVQDD